jgi:DNA segregation ATPase FtsK/SpoIIIE-like protein
MDASDPIVVGKGDAQQVLRLPVANRHGLIAGATGTGKTVSLQILA